MVRGVLIDSVELMVCFLLMVMDVWCAYDGGEDVVGLVMVIKVGWA